MPKPAEPESRNVLTAAAEQLLARVREWWQRHNELGSFDRNELQRIAGEFGMTASELEGLVARGPHAADLLYQRMQTLGITRTDVERVASGLARDLEKSCACCNDKVACKRDLASGTDDPAWKDYCPNAISLESVKRAKGRFA